MIKLVVTCDNCGRKIEDPTEEPFYHVTIREKCEKPDSAVYTVNQYDMILCNECEGRFHEKPEAAVEEKPKGAVKKEKPEKEKKQEAVQEKPKAAVEEVAPVQQEKKKVDHIMVKVLMKQGWNQSKIAKELGVTPAAISQIVKKYKEYKEMEE